jgi:hypothetical protein
VPSSVSINAARNPELVVNAMSSISPTTVSRGTHGFFHPQNEAGASPILGDERASDPSVPRLVELFELGLP